MKWQQILESDVPILAPWNTPNYLPLNGFHPLLEGFLKSQNRILVPDLANMISEGALPNRYIENFFFDRPMQLLAKQSKKLPVWQVQKLLELHHTRFPSTNNPFVLHFESISTLAMPFTQTGKTLRKRDLRKIREIFRKGLSINNLALVTHVDQSISDFEQALEVLRLEQKTVQKINPLALYNPVVPSFPKSKNPRIVFSNSSHQHSQNFVNRGGLALLNSLPSLIHDYPEIEVYILGVSPSRLDLEHLEIRPEARSLIDRITWVDGYLPEQLMDYFIGTAWVYVLASAHLHTASLIRAHKLGTHVICSPVPGIESTLREISNYTLLEGSLDDCVVQHLLGYPEVRIDLYNSKQSDIIEILHASLRTRIEQGSPDIARADNNLIYDLDFELSPLPKISHFSEFVPDKTFTYYSKKMSVAAPVLLSDFAGWKVYNHLNRYLTFDTKSRVVSNSAQFQLVTPSKYGYFLNRVLSPVLVNLLGFFFRNNKKEPIERIKGIALQQQYGFFITSVGRKIASGGLSKRKLQLKRPRVLRGMLKIIVRSIYGSTASRGYIEAIDTWPKSILFRKIIAKLLHAWK